ncbi:conserved hypothetical protein [Xanthomonas phaseoli pv. phaseoli]|uniref:Uncharacterized protein n=1 Tax=Xanthomonas campestris pv. phaseoli TaxID=317013 RepID=A0AB38DVX8_XANCH|nr:conserved hypothetical protein [Xanthomonas phaseoli pv. phaseoli]SON77324.1 conserved hypothetical protein [Xanthomonas phaseoli pv. phaseoli]SON82054.1 conserved hypothetical protein [Xanthomonas phaseoli pv. phaseoli]
MLVFKLMSPFFMGATSSKGLSRPVGASHFSLLVQRKVTKRKHTPSSRLPRYALQVRMPSGNFSKGRPCPFEKRRASMRAAPAGFDPDGLPLRYGGPEKQEPRSTNLKART